MDMNIVTPPKKGLKTRHYSKDMNMNNNVATLPKKSLKTRHYNKDMNMDNNVATLPKKGLKTRQYNIGMEKRDLKKYDHTMYMDMEKKYLKKLTKGQLIKLVLKQKESKKFITMSTCSTMTHLRMKLHKSLQNESNHQNPLESHHLHQSLKLKIT